MPGLLEGPELAEEVARHADTDPRPGGLAALQPQRRARCAGAGGGAVHRPDSGGYDAG